MTTASNTTSFVALNGIGAVIVGDDIPSIITTTINLSGQLVKAGDVFIIAQKIVSKSEGRIIDLRSVSPSPKAIELAASANKDPRIVEVIISEAREIIRVQPGIIIVETHHGIVMANAGVDQSNVEQSNGSENVLLLPCDPDKSASQIKEALCKQFGVHLGVVIVDSIGRAWREGTVGTAIGSSGFAPIKDYRGLADMNGRVIQNSMAATADALAAAGNLMMGEGAEGTPVVLASGAAMPKSCGSASELFRPRTTDLFR